MPSSADSDCSPDPDVIPLISQELVYLRRVLALLQELACLLLVLELPLLVLAFLLLELAFLLLELVSLRQPESPEQAPLVFRSSHLPP